MADEWSPLRLGDVCTKIGSGATPRGGSEVYLEQGPFALIRSQNVYNDGFHRNGLAYIGEKHAAELEGVEVSRNDVLLNITGDSVARACQVDPCVLPARVNQHVAIIRPDPEKLDPRFLRYVLVSPETQSRLLSWAGAGGTRNALTKAMIESLEVLAPEDVGEQRTIAHILGTLDDRIEANRRMAATLEEMARAIFKDWFIDFGPTRAKMEGRARYLAPEIWSVFPDRLDEEGKPAGWHTGNVSEIGQVICGKTPSTAVNEYYGNDVPFVTIPDMHGKIFVLRSTKNLSHFGASSQQNKTLPAGSICVSCIATPGLVVMTTRPSQTNQQINSVVPQKPHETLYWYWVLRDLGEDIRQGGSGGSVLSNLSTGRFMELSVLMASAEARAAYETAAKPLFSRILANEKGSQTLAATRDLLIPKLMSGEVRVKAAEAFLRKRGL